MQSGGLVGSSEHRGVGRPLLSPQRFQKGPELVRQSRRAAAARIDIDMHEETLGGSLLFARLKQADLISDARIANMGDADPGIHAVGKAERCGVAAPCFDNQTNHRAGLWIQKPFVNQGGIHSRVEEAIVNDIVHMAINIIIHPTRGNLAEAGVVMPRMATRSRGVWTGGRCFGHVRSDNAPE